MHAIAPSQRWALPLDALSSRFSPTGLKWSSGGAALVLHVGLGAAALWLMHSQPNAAPLTNRTLNVTLFTPVEVEPTVEPAEETVIETPPVAEPLRWTPSSRRSPRLLPGRERFRTCRRCACRPDAGPDRRGWRSGLGADAGLQVSEGTAGALRGLLCAGGSEHTRAAAGCGPAAQTDPNGYAAFASAEEIAKIESAFGPIETLGYAGGSTVNLGSFALPGQVNNNQPHYVSGVHSVFGQLPVSDKVRDPGFGD